MKEKPFNFFVVEYKIIKYFKFLSTQETFGTKKALYEITDEFLAIGRQVAVKQLSQFPSILVTRVPPSVTATTSAEALDQTWPTYSNRCPQGNQLSPQRPHFISTL